MRIAYLLPLAFALAGGCIIESDESEKSETRGPVREAGWERAPLEECDARELKNREWFAQWQTCESDEDCTVATLEAGCSSPFYCPVGLSVHADRVQLELDALERAASYEQACGCADADCVHTGKEPAVCDRETKRCRPEPR